MSFSSRHTSVIRSDTPAHLAAEPMSAAAMSVKSGRGALFALLSLMIATPAAAQATDSTGKTDAQAEDSSILRVCAAANEHPFSTRDGKGFENKIAEVVAKAMGRTVVYSWHNKPAIYLVRDKLDMRVCDVVIGIDADDPRVTTTKAYYRAPYVFVQRKDSPLNITTWESEDLVKANRIGFAPGTPAQVMLTKIDLFNIHFNYMNSLTNFQSRRNQFTRIDPVRMIGEVADGTAEIAIGFAPEVARYVRDNTALKMTVIPDNNVRVDGERVPHHFDQAMGVRKGDTKLQADLNAAIDKARPEIEQILKDESIPLLELPQRS